MLNEKFIEKLEELIEQKNQIVIDKQGNEYTTNKLHSLQPDYINAECLQVQTLTGLIKYLTQPGLDELKTCIDDASFYLIHISATEVKVFGTFDEMHRRRTKYIEAIYTGFDFKFNTYYNIEDMIIKLQTNFAPQPDRDNLLAMLGNLVYEESLKCEDDGINQNVVIKNGFAVSQKKEIKNPIFLVPSLSFPEIAMDSLPFILRVKKTNESLTVGLFAYNKAYSDLTISHKIAKYIEKELMDTPPRKPYGMIL